MSTTQGRGWEQRLLDVFDDLEQQARGLALLERDTEVADVAAVEYAAIDLSARLRASAGRVVATCLRGGWEVTGEVLRAGPSWALLGGADGARWCVDLAQVLSVSGASRSASHPSTTPLGDRSPTRSLLRRVAEHVGSGPAGTAQVHLVDGQRVGGRLGRVGADFVELVTGPARGARDPGSREPILVALGAVAAVRWSSW